MNPTLFEELLTRLTRTPVNCINTPPVKNKYKVFRGERFVFSLEHNALVQVEDLNSKYNVNIVITPVM